MAYNDRLSSGGMRGGHGGITNPNPQLEALSSHMPQLPSEENTAGENIYLFYLILVLHKVIEANIYHNEAIIKYKYRLTNLALPKREFVNKL